MQQVIDKMNQCNKIFNSILKCRKGTKKHKELLKQFDAIESEEIELRRIKGILTHDPCNHVSQLITKECSNHCLLFEGNFQCPHFDAVFNKQELV